MATRGATLKMVKQINVAFDPFTNASTVAREFIRRVAAPKLLKDNPKFVLNTTVKTDGTDPHIEVIFLDKEKTVIEAKNVEFDEMYSSFIKMCKEKEK